MEHPPERDLINFAKEEITRKKRQRILDHCKQCDACADRLLEMVREHAPDPGPMRLSRWQKASIALFVLALLALVAIFVWWIRATPRRMAPPVDPSELEKLEEDPSPPSRLPNDPAGSPR